jgi:PAS domain S-box-containing protein
VTADMSVTGFQLPCLRDSRLAPLATSALPAWIWSTDGTHIMWANPVGAAIFGAPTSAAIGARTFDASQPAAAQIARLVTTLIPGASPRLERLRGFGAGVGCALTCACSHIMLSGDTPAILVVAAERAGPNLPLQERVRRLLAGSDEPVAAFAADDTLVHATQSAQAYLRGTTSLAALGGEALVVEALNSGHAQGRLDGGQVALDIAFDVALEGAIDVSIDRVGGGTATVLIARFSTTHVGQESGEQEFAAQAAVARPATVALPATTATADVPTQMTAPAPDAPPSEPAPLSSPEAPTERRHPLRFVWQMDGEGRFTLGSDEFIALIGPRTAAQLGRPWQDLATDLALDPERQIARAIATHDTWSGLTVVWPVDDSPDRLAVELSGLPVFDRDRIFRGYRGFGVCRDLARLTALARLRAAPPAAPPQETTAEETTAREPARENAPELPPDILPTAPPTGERAMAQLLSDDAASNDALSINALSDEAISGEAATHGALYARVPPAENIVPFRPAIAEPNAPALSAVERSAFRELSRKLKQRLKGIQHADTGSSATPSVDDAAVAEAALAGSVTGARPMLDKLAVGILIYRFDQLLYANPAFLQGSGHQSLEGLAAAGGLDELFIEPIGAATVGDDKALTLTIDRGDKISVKGELINIHWEGEPAHALITAAEAGEPARLTPAQAEIAELKSILDTATDGVVLLDAQGLIVSANRSAKALFGYEELVGRAFAELFAPESTDMARDYLDGLVRDGAVSMLNGGREVIGRVRQGGLIPLFMTMGRIGDETDKLCAVFRDITSWKKAEEDLTQARRQAEKASSAKSDFLAKISHEIRTPLNAIIGFSEVMMEERFGPIGNERYREYLKDIHASGGHLLSLINDLLDLSKIEAGKLELTFAGVALNDLTQQCVAIMQPQANRERIIIRTSLPQTLPLVVADARSVRQIVLNLLSNSIKFTGAGGQVIVSTALNDNGEVVLRVRDTGIGMSEMDLVTALEPFRQLSTSARGGSGGTGLGLPLTKALAEANRARFHIKSALKEGTLIEIAFPAALVLAG